VSADRLFTLAEANALVPRLVLLIERLQRGARLLNDEMLAEARASGVEPGALTTEELLRRRPGARVVVEELDATVHEIQESGAELKDVRLGLVDFPAERDGEQIYLCWQYGEPAVAFWHRLDAGFGGREPLPGANRTRVLQ
jgi:hypothetical protein